MATVAALVARVFGDAGERLPVAIDAVCEAGEGRARVWRLYMAASAVNFEDGRTQVHQVLATKTRHGRSGLPLRPQFAP